MRIVLVSTNLLPTPPMYGGGIETWVYGFAKESAKLGHEVHLLGLPNPTISYEEIIFHPLLSTQKVGILALSSNVWRILRDIRRKGPVDLVLTNHFNTWLTVPFVDSRLKVQIWHNIPKANLINKIVARGYDLCCGVSANIAKELPKRLNIDQTRVGRISDFVDVDFFKPDNTLRENFRMELGLADEPVILYIGRIIPSKGIKYLFNIFSTLHTEFNDSKLLIVGPKGEFSESDSPCHFSVRKFIADKRIEKSIIYLGRIQRKEIPKVYNAADLLINPTLMKVGQGLLTTMEAMASAKPVVAFKTGAISEIMESGTTGMLAEREEYEALLKVTRVLLGDKELREEIGKRAREHIVENFSSRKVVKEALTLLLSKRSHLSEG